MVWENAENGFHGVEDFSGDDSPCGGGFERRRVERRAGVNGDKSGFHGVEVLRKVGSMAWKIGEFDFHGVEPFADFARVLLPAARGGRKADGRWEGNRFPMSGKTAGNRAVDLAIDRGAEM